jgi:hypothetical protein
MTHAIKALVAVTCGFGLLVSAALAQQAGTGPGGGRKQHEQKNNTAASTAPKADDKAYNAALKSLPNKPYDPWSGTR